MMDRMSSVIVAPVSANDPSQTMDCAYFERNLNTVEYIHDVLPGEAPASMPTDMRVVFRCVGVQRIGAFVLPSSEVN